MNYAIILLLLLAIGTSICIRKVYSPKMRPEILLELVATYVAITWLLAFAICCKAFL